MKLIEAASVLRSDMEALGLDPQHLSPWPAWKAFKAFLEREVLADVYDTSSFQCEHDVGEADRVGFLVYYVRQFSRRDAVTGEDLLVGRVVVELRYTPAPPGARSPVELWSMDFPADGEWVSVVEGSPAFQEAMAPQPEASDIYLATDG